MKVVADRYEISERIGDGGMADVYRAHDRMLDRDVAVKVLRPHFAEDPEFVTRFQREAEALASIEHHAIVRVFDWGTSEDGPFIAMELVTGGSLRDLMRREGRLTERDTAALGASIADALEAAHLRGVLHRDLKPDNVLLDADDYPKLADFGIARIAAATAVTRPGELLGTPRYLAPEQLSEDVVDERADVYALGVILYELLSGAQPTGGTTASEVVSRRLRLDPKPVRQVAPVSRETNDVVMRALARDPARRYPRARDLAAALRTLLVPAAPRIEAKPAIAARVVTTIAPIGVAATSAPIAAAAKRSVPVAAAPKRARVVRPAPRRASLAAFAAVLLALLGGGAVVGSSRVQLLQPVPARTQAPLTPAVAASTAAPAVTAAPAMPALTFEPTPEPTPVPTPAPTVAPTRAPVVVVVPASGGPDDAIASFYRFISGHEYGAAADMWSARMKASYPPQTNIWGRFDRTSRIVTRSAAVTSVTPTSATVAVDLVETMSDGTVRRWVGTWALVKSGSIWLLDRPGLRPG